MSRERLWSPQMRKWIKDSERHGRKVKFASQAAWGGGRGSQYRLTDTFDDRVIDGWNGNTNIWSAFARITD